MGGWQKRICLNGSRKRCCRTLLAPTTWLAGSPEMKAESDEDLTELFYEEILTLDEIPVIRRRYCWRPQTLSCLGRTWKNCR